MTHLSARGREIIKSTSIPRAQQLFQASKGIQIVLNGLKSTRNLNLPRFWGEKLEYVKAATFYMAFSGLDTPFGKEISIKSNLNLPNSACSAPSIPGMPQSLIPTSSQPILGIKREIMKFNSRGKIQRVPTGSRWPKNHRESQPAKGFLGN